VVGCDRATEERRGRGEAQLLRRKKERREKMPKIKDHGPHPDKKRSP